MELKNLKNEIKNIVVQTGISSDAVILAKSLVDNKIKNSKLFICEGLWAVDKLIEKNIKVTHFILNGDKLNNDNFSDSDLVLIYKACKYAKKSYAVSDKECKKISDRDGKDDFFIIAEMPTYTLADLSKLIKKNNNVLGIIMDGLEQPGNIGAILRTCDGAGATFAISVNKQASITNSRLVRASFGSVFMIPTLEEDIISVQKWLEDNNFKTVVTDLQATKNFKEVDYSGRVAIVAGNEHTGISPSWRKIKGSQSVIIPMLGSIESLNVGFATTLVAYEAGLSKFLNKR
ncbi:MAG: hypothetical protein IJT25_00695 [Clostridia bacterium]|nr:hypothetical protein [Clostridia bacterium]